MNEQNRSLVAKSLKLIQRLIEPSSDISEIQQRHQARLLSAILLFIILLGSISGMIQLLIVRGFLPTFVAIAGAVIVMSIAYALTRTKYYLPAAAITSITPSIASYAGLLTNTNDQAAFVFMLISVLLSSILLNQWLTIGIAALNLFGLVLLPMLQPAWTVSMTLGVISYHVIIPALIVLAIWHRDLVERDRQKELLASELKFRSIFDNSIDAIGVSRNDLHIVVNQAYLQMFGYATSESLAGTSIFDLIAPSEWAKIPEYTRQFAGKNLPAIYETRGIRRDRSEFDMEVHVSSYKLSNELYDLSILRDITERKRAEEALRESEQKFSILFEKATFAISLSRMPDGVIVDVNEAFEKIFGYTKQEAIGKTSLELGINPDAEGRARILAFLKEQGSARNLELALHPKSGEVRIFIVNVDLVDIGQKKYILNATQDITERKRADEALRASQALFHSLVESMPLNVVSKDLQGRFTFANQHFSVAESKSVDEIVGRTDFDLYPPDLARKYQEDDRRVMETGQTINIEEEHQPLGGDRAFVQVIKTPLYDANTQVTGVLVMHWDITERKQAEKKLHQQNLRLKTLREIDTAILAADSVESIVGAALGHIRELIECRRASLALVDWETGEALLFDVKAENESFMPKGTRVLLAMSQDMLPILRMNQSVLINDLTALPDLPPQFQTGINEGFRSVCVLPLFSQSNLIGMFSMSSETVGFFDEARINLGREVANQIAIAITQSNLHNELRNFNSVLEQRVREREELITEITAKNAELERFTYMVSHDLKSPLVTMKGFLGYLEQDALSGNLERLKGDIKRIANAVDKMSQLLDDLLELSRIGRFINPPEQIPFEEVAKAGLEMVQAHIEQRRISIDLQPDLPVIYGDRVRLIEVLQNLIDNAAKYMGDQPMPRIEIGRCGEEDDKPLFYVRDNGVGIALEYREKIFGLFNKLDARTEGTGIGLALVKRIIEFHGGRIWVESKVGKGSTFCFTLPAKPKAPRSNSKQT